MELKAWAGSVNISDTPSMTPKEFLELRAKPHQMLGESVKVLIPAGNYDASRLLNLGTNRWATKAEADTLSLSRTGGFWKSKGAPGSSARLMISFPEKESRILSSPGIRRLYKPRVTEPKIAPVTQGGSAIDTISA